MIAAVEQLLNTPARESPHGLVFVFSGPGDKVPTREGRTADQLGEKGSVVHIVLPCTLA